MRIAVIGTGLMGTSVALAARRRGDDVAGWDPDTDVLARAAARDALEPTDSLDTAVKNAELVVVAAPIGQLPSTVAAVLAATTDATVTDVGSTKASVVRAANGSPRFVGGHPICGSEARGPDHASAALQEHRRRIEQVEAALDQGDAGFLARWIGEASQSRRRMLEREYPDPGTLQRVRVHVPDRPGVLAGITQALGAERINIEDFELHHVSPERGGTLTLLVAGETEAQRAASLLESQGYSVVVSAVIDAD